MTKAHKTLYNYRLLILAFIAGAAALILERNIITLDSKSISTIHFQSVLDNKYQKANESLEQIADIIKKEGLDVFKNSYAEQYYDLYDEYGIVIIAYDNQDVKFWNSNILPLQTDDTLPDWEENMINPGNGWFAVTQMKAGDSLNLFGLILIKHDYVFENEFLTNDFHPDFKLFAEAELGFDREKTNIIKDPDGNFLFCLIEPYPPVYSRTFSLLSCIMYSLGILILLIFLYKSFYILRFKSIYGMNLWFLAVITLLIISRYMMLETGFPQILKDYSLFQPHHYAKSSIFPSLGDFLINSVLILFIAICFSVHFRLFDSGNNPCKTKCILWVLVMNLSLVAFMLFFHYMFAGLVHDSNIQLEVYNFFYLNQFSFVAYLILAILLASLVLITDRVVFLSSMLVELKSFILIFLASFISGILIFNALEIPVNIYALIFFIALTGSITIIRFFNYRYKYSLQVFLVLLISIFSLAFITNKSREKEKNIRQLLVVNLANERDQIAEFLLEDIDTNLENDSTVLTMLESPYHDDHELFDYLESNYFNGYFRKYELQVASCGHDFDLLLEDVNELVDCYSFFYDMAENYGIPVSSNSSFYFLDNLNGRISYLGTIVYEYSEYPYEKTLFISLDSKLLNDQLGYPELLLEGKFGSNMAMIQYSHAKYNNGQLITRSGSYSYPLILEPDEESSDKEFYFMEKEGYEHLIYQIDEENVIVLSKPETTVIDLLTSFTYSFAFFFLLYSLALLICKYPVSIKRWRIDFKNKIKFSMIGVLLLSLIIIGAGTVYYNIRQFENKQYESISEKIQSVLVELEYRLGLENELTPEMSYYITGLLIQFSNVFYTDINLYDLEGNLYASSRPEVFELGLIGEQMDPEAYSEMLLKNNSRFVHNESISDLSYLSAYVPFTNADNKILAYLNLPYFTRQSILKKEIYTVVVAVANIYAILILITILLAIIVSNTITKPLQLIQKKLRELSIGKSNEQIDYESDDEIGSLIKEYNRMVMELENSAGLLARSERESAWREMAKQIAHEIKNPLTPMKLSVQHLQRSWDDKVENWDELLRKTTRNLVEQIDHLSSIATAFSHFAKLPGANRGKVDIVNTITNIATLFSNTENTEIIVRLNGTGKLNVISDKIQLNRVFINLLKNAIQSVPKNKKGIITIELIKEQETALVKITDNGQGIPAEIRDKMFTPNFTSKSGGTGLGLAIVKNIIEQSGGEVGYTSEYMKGSCFFFRLPYAPDNEHSS
ncbi:MAG: ATP-binding protein [Bacteroidales bacterium]